MKYEERHANVRVWLCISIVIFEISQVSLDDCFAAFLSCLGEALACRASTMRIITKNPPDVGGIFQAKCAVIISHITSSHPYPEFSSGIKNADFLFHGGLGAETPDINTRGFIDSGWKSAKLSDAVAERNFANHRR